MSKPPRILVVDDDESIRKTLRAALEGDGHRVETAGDGEAGLARICDEAFDLVLLDLKMPRMNGQEVLTEAHRARPDLPIVIITAHGDVETAVEALQSGAAHFIQKPLSVADVRTLVRTMLESKAPNATSGDTYEELLLHARQAVEERHLDGALRHARAALALAPTRPEAFNVMGVSHQLQMNTSRAQKYYRAALSLDPTYVPAQRNLDNTSSVPRRPGAFDLG